MGDGVLDWVVDEEDADDSMEAASWSEGRCCVPCNQALTFSL